VFYYGILRERHHLKDTGVHGRIILIWISKKFNESVDCIGVDQGRNKWMALLYTVVNLQVL
jgi:hypothetical protein